MLVHCSVQLPLGLGDRVAGEHEDGRLGPGTVRSFPFHLGGGKLLEDEGIYYHGRPRKKTKHIKSTYE